MTLSKRLEPTLLTDQVYAVLHEAIITGELPAGSRLRVRDIAAQVGTSVMPVREAIRRLEEAGLAQREPHKGAVVKGLTLQELVHVYGVRRLLEGEAARLGAEQISAEDCARMQAEYDLMVTAITERRVVDILDHDEALLEILYTASGNPVLVNMIRTLWQHCRAYKIVGAQGTLYAEGEDSLWRYQKRLVAAARKQDAETARSVSDASLDNATLRIKALLAAQDEEDKAGVV
ncbi:MULTISPECIES: GntR family transcriptional regulator [unclassified Kribbella]|uniref:GntR family transcriptional regulator n=1 Tax=unclassified Kribbella TaxID=2644121 RepID=UPI0033D1CAEA